MKTADIISGAHKIKKAVKEKPNIYVFILSFLLVFVYTNIVNNQYVWGDAGSYMNLSRSFASSSPFQLLDFPQSIRGIIFPLVLFFCNTIASIFSSNMYMGWRILVSLAVAAITAIFSILFEGFRKEKVNIGFRLLPVVLIMFFWSGLLNYSLSDLIAVSFLILGFYFFHRATSPTNTNKIKQYLFVFLAGIFLYSAYNTRTIYLFPALFFVPIVFAFELFNKKTSRKKLIPIAVFLIVGVLAAGAIQAAINYHHHGLLSIEVITTYGEYTNLFDFQLTEGLKNSQYETYVGGIKYPEQTPQYPVPGVRFIDPAGKRLSESISSWWGIFSGPSNFFTAIGVYLRHFINMLNPVFGEIYIEDLYALKIHRSLLNYGFLFLIAKQFSIYAKSGRTRLVFNLKEKYIPVIFGATLLLACMAIVFGAVEQRFFVPMYLVMYAMMAYCVEYKKIWKDIKSSPISNAIVFVGCYAILLSSWATTYALTAENVRISIF